MTYDVDEIMAEVFGTDDELVTEMYESPKKEPKDPAVSFFLPDPAVAYRCWWLERYTVKEIKWLAAGLEQLG